MYNDTFSTAHYGIFTLYCSFEVPNNNLTRCVFKYNKMPKFYTGRLSITLFFVINFNINAKRSSSEGGYSDVARRSQTYTSGKKCYVHDASQIMRYYITISRVVIPRVIRGIVDEVNIKKFADYKEDVWKITHVLDDLNVVVDDSV